jgi:GTPase SAR1 family protein
MNSKIQIPIDNINICILGCVSTGKSTILNAMFCQDFSQSKIKRTTMMPTAFVETRNPSICKSQTQISTEITEINSKIITSTEAGQILNLQKYGSQLIFNVDKLDIRISEKFNVTIFDMPGLNDARTKEQYFKYLMENFYLFNIIIFVVNIESGLNTSDEIEILNLISSNIEAQSKLGKQIKMLTIANKADEMQLNSRTGYPEIVSEELKEMYEQITHTIEQNFREKKIIDSLIGIVPICGIDAHLFRMIKSKGINYELNPTQIQRIGISEMGNRFRAKTPIEQKNIVNKVISSGDDFIDQMIKLSGFERIDVLLGNCIKSQSNTMVNQNIEQELKNMQPISIYSIIETLIPILNIYIKIEKMDKIKYNKYMEELSKEIHTQIYNKVNHFKTVESVIKSYRDVIDKIINNFDSIKIPEQSGFVGLVSSYFKTKDTTAYKMLANFIEFDKYPAYLIKKVMELIKTEFNEHKISINRLKYFLTIKNLGFLSKNIIEILLDKIISNPNETNTIDFEKESSELNNEIIEIFNQINIADNFMMFLRFFLRNKIDSIKSNNQQIILKLFLYKKYGEIPIQEYIRCKISSLNPKIFGNIFDIGLSDSKNIQQLIFDIYYINLAKIKDIQQFQYFNQVCQV